MLPRTNPKMVFLNPNFKKTHINPTFLLSNNNPPSSIHINPAFLERIEPTGNDNAILSENLQTKPEETKLNISKGICRQSENLPKMELITKSRTKIVRVPINQKGQQENPPPRGNLIKIGSKKLIRTSNVSGHYPAMKIATSSCSLLPRLEISSKPIMKKGKYKLDRRILTTSSRSIFSSVKRKEFVSKYALSHVHVKDSLPVKKVIVTTRMLRRIGTLKVPSMNSKFSTVSVNKKLELLNINGVLYRSTKTKLEKTNSLQQGRQQLSKPNMVKSTNSSTENKKRILYVRGDKFLLDKSGFSLTRAENSKYSKMNLKRIDIGGLTYVAKSQNVFLRTDTHKTRNHLSVAKQKSINTLSKNLVKTNVPCPIFVKVGKCAAFERGKCPKVHDSLQVSICPKFLKGECANQKCLLSHNVSLSKMPTCRFFLQGCCVREDCPYLHKKVSDKAEICIEFLRGFCHLAEKCKKRHEFLCPDYESTGKCEKNKCIYCQKRIKQRVTVKRTRKDKEEMSKEENIKSDQKNIVSGASNPEDHFNVKQLPSRYFADELENKYLDDFKDKANSEKQDRSDDDQQSPSKGSFQNRPKLGNLPAFIPL